MSPQTDAQQKAALDKGRRVRSLRAGLRAAIKEGSVDPFDLVEGHGNAERSHGTIAADMKVRDLVLLIPGVGEQTALQALSALGIPTDREVRLWGLTYSQRAELANLLRDACGEPRPLRTGRGL